MPCAICQSFEHLVEECPIIPAAREIFASNLEQVIVNLTKVVEDFVANQKSIIDQFRQEKSQVRQEIDNQDRKMDGRLNDLSQKTDNLEYSNSRLINLNTKKVKVVMVDQPTFKPKYDEGLPESLEKLANLSSWTRRKEMQPLLNAVEIQRHAKKEPQSLFLTRYLRDEICISGRRQVKQTAF
ncbi:hypothetical protein AAG906_020707 [Vitis piasezkii]